MINFFNYLFANCSRQLGQAPDAELPELDTGHVAMRGARGMARLRDDGRWLSSKIAGACRTERRSSGFERDSRELIKRRNWPRRINDLVNPGSAISVTGYSDVALLFRAMTRVHFYEARFGARIFPINSSWRAPERERSDSFSCCAL